MKVLETVEAAPQVAQWLNNILQPAAAALRVVAPPPIHFTSVGKWGGVSDGSPQNPQRRICFSPRVKMFRHSAIIELWVHEICHRTLQDVVVIDHAHNAAFFCLQSWCYLRLQKAGVLAADRVSDWMLSSSFYDLQDKPIEGPAWDSKSLGQWLPECLEWSLTTAEELFADARFETMEQVAREILRRYDAWQDLLLLEPQKQAAVEAVLTSLRAQVLHERELNSIWRKVNLQTMFAGFLGWFGLVLMVLKPWH